MRFFDRFFNFIFVLILFLPLVFLDFSSDRISIMENRRLANRPFFSGLKKDPNMFFRDFDAWFKDSTGFREKLISLYKKTDGIFIQNSYLDGTSVVFIGKQGHHFHTHYNELLPIWQGKRWLDDAQSYELSKKLNNIDQYLKEKKIPFITMSCTDKESIYPEYYPDFVIKGLEPTSLDVVVNYISTHTNIDFFCVKESLLKEKENWLLYPKTGDIYELCHYNETGSFVAYRELMRHINKYFPNLKPFTFDDVDITYLFNGSSNVTLKQEKNYNVIEARFFDDAVEFENDDTSLPVILLLCDSYAEWFKNYLPQHFGRTIVHHWYKLDQLEEFIDLYKPDIVVIEFAERAIPCFARTAIAMHKLP